MSGKSTERAQYLCLAKAGHESSGQGYFDYCVSQTLFHVCRSREPCNRSRVQSDWLERLGKGNSACRGVLLGGLGAIRLYFDGLVLDKAIPHYPS